MLPNFPFVEGHLGQWRGLESTLTGPISSDQAQKVLGIGGSPRNPGSAWYFNRGPHA